MLINGKEYQIGPGADLTGANLCEANLTGADLCEANLRWANLSGADLRRANLRWANLSEADLSGANLSEADLSEADLSRANLIGTCLDPSSPVPSLSEEVLSSAGFTVSDGKIYGYRTRYTQHNGDHEYTPGEHTCPVFSVSDTPCHPGIYLSGLAWLKENYPNKDFVRCYALQGEIVKAGDKFRAKRIFVIGAYEKDAELGA
jgi:hypothetical protein